MNFLEEKNLQNEGLAGKWIFGHTWQVAEGEADMLLDFFTDFGGFGDVAHFFWRCVSINDTNVIMQFACFWNVKKPRKALQNEK